MFGQFLYVYRVVGACIVVYLIKIELFLDGVVLRKGVVIDRAELDIIIRYLSQVSLKVHPIRIDINLSALLPRKTR